MDFKCELFMLNKINMLLLLMSIKTKVCVHSPVVNVKRVLAALCKYDTNRLGVWVITWQAGV